MRTSRSRTALLVLLILALGCVSSAKTVQVTVAPNNNLVFQPNNITINVGDTVQWVWSGSNHSTTSGTCNGSGGVYGGGCTPDGNWDSQVQNAPFNFSHSFRAAGTFPYFCRIHGASFGMTGTVTVVQPDFSLTMETTNPGQVLVGQTASFSGRLSTGSGYSSAVNLSCVAVSGLPNPCTPSPGSAVPSSSGAGFNVNAGSSSAQDIQFAVRGVGTDPSHVTHTSGTLTLHVVDLSVGSISPSPLTVSHVGSSSATFTVSGSNGFTGAADFACSNLPANTSCSFSPNPANLSSSVTSVNVTVTVTTDHALQGSYSVKVNATTAGASAPRSTTFTLNVQADYAVALTNPIVQVFPGQAGTFNGTLTPLDGYTSPGSGINITCGQFDTTSNTISCSPPGAPIPVSGAAANFSVGFNTNSPGTTAPADYVANITGTDANNIIHSAPATVRVVDFSLAPPRPTSVSVAQGNPTAPILLTVSALGQWTPTVNLACGGPAITAGAQCFFSPSASLGPSSSRVVTLVIEAGAAPVGTSTVTLTATVPTTTQVSVGPNGGFFFSPGEITINQGDTVEWDWAPPVSIYPNQHSTTSGSCVPQQPPPALPVCTPDGNWDSGLNYPPHSFSQTFTAAGMFPYYCQMHGPTYGMVGTVTVRSHSQPLTLNVTSAASTADLSVALSHVQMPGKTDPAPVGGSVQLNATVTNNTSGSSESANLVLTFSPPVTIGTLPGSCTTSNGNVICAFTSVNGTPAAFSVPVTAPFSRTVTVEAFISSAANNSTPASATANDTVQVRPRPLSRNGLPAQIP